MKDEELFQTGETWLIFLGKIDWAVSFKRNATFSATGFHKKIKEQNFLFNLSFLRYTF